MSDEEAKDNIQDRFLGSGDSFKNILEIVKADHFNPQKAVKSLFQLILFLEALLNAYDRMYQFQILDIIHQISQFDGSESTLLNKKLNTKQPYRLYKQAFDSLVTQHKESVRKDIEK